MFDISLIVNNIIIMCFFHFIIFSLCTLDFASTDSSLLQGISHALASCLACILSGFSKYFSLSKFSMLRHSCMCFWSFPISVNILQQWKHISVSPSWIVFMCILRFLWWVKFWSQWGQQNFVPIWMDFMCLPRCPLSVNNFSQWGQENVSPSWTDFTWIFRLFWNVAL